MTKTKLIAYWATTVLIALVVLSGGVMQLVHQRDAVEGIVHLGYPLYFVTILGFWKLAGGLAILVPKFPRLKEWAYAGIFIELTGASASHLAVGDPVGNVIAPLVLAGLVVASWALRPPSRVLGKAM